MEFHSDRNESSPLPSATVMLLRDGVAGLEVFLLERHGLSDVLGGAYVFPGGKMDADDAELAGRLDQPAERLHAALGEEALTPVEAAALHVAAVREVFEETGVLYAPVDGAVAKQAWASMREGRRFGEVLEAMDLPIVTMGLAPWSRWITPLVGGVVRKRFDTRFFVAAVPGGQEPVHDEHEAVASVWLRPADALKRYWEGGIQLAPPQIMSLSHLARLPDVAAALDAARSRRPPRIQPEAGERGGGRGRRPPLIQPEAFERDGMRVLCYPGDERHSVRERAMPGPTRLCWRNKRFEPDEGGLPVLLG